MKYLLFNPMAEEIVYTEKAYIIPNGQSLEALAKALVIVAVDAKTNGHELIVVPSDISPWTEGAMLELALEKAVARFGVVYRIGPPLGELSGVGVETAETV